MPRSSEHKEKAERNRLFLNSIKGNAAYADWAAVVAFYAAMHLVERLAAYNNIHHTSHAVRLSWVSKPHRPIYVAFSVLYDASCTARYGTANQFPSASPGNTVETVLVDQHLATIEAYVTTFF